MLALDLVEDLRRILVALLVQRPLRERIERVHVARYVARVARSLVASASRGRDDGGAGEQQDCGAGQTQGHGNLISVGL